MSSGATSLALTALRRWKTRVILSLLFSEWVLALSSQQDDFIVHLLNSEEFDGHSDDPFYEDDFDNELSTERANKADLEESPREDEVKENQSYLVNCDEDAMKVILPLGKLSEVRIFGMSVMDPVWKACGYSLTKKQGKIVLRASYSACHVSMEQDGSYTLWVKYRNSSGKTDVAFISCNGSSSHVSSSKQHQPQSDSPSFKCPPPPLPPPPPTPPLPPFVTLPPPMTFTGTPTQSAAMSPTQTTPLGPPWIWTLPSVHKQAGCSIPSKQRVSCGPSGVTITECLKMGCCMDMQTCFYPMDECTLDGQFIFAIPADFTSTPVNPTNLVVVGQEPCKPVIANKDFAVFKFAVTDCGTRSYQIGNTIVYMAEVRTMVRVLNTKYGIIFRDQPLRVMVECRFSKFTPSVVKASAGYMVMSPSLPGLVRASGLFGVQLRIAEDSTFSRFYPQYHQPLRVLLGKPVYLELQLVSPKPEATLLVHYCVAYPRSAKSALVLLYEGCPNPLDSGNISILHMAVLPQNRHQRRFFVNAFQFMDQSTRKYLDEEIYFMCSTEVCLQSDTPCKETCFDQK